jgi:hypothetical protein
MKKIRDIMRHGFLFMVQRTATVAEAVHLMTSHNVGIVIVLDGDKLVGVFSERDVVRRVVDKGLDLAHTPMEAVMTRELVVADARRGLPVGNATPNSLKPFGRMPRREPPGRARGPAHSAIPAGARACR